MKTIWEKVTRQNCCHNWKYLLIDLKWVCVPMKGHNEAMSTVTLIINVMFLFRRTTIFGFVPSVCIEESSRKDPEHVCSWCGWCCPLVFLFLQHSRYGHTQEIVVSKESAQLPPAITFLCLTNTSNWDTDCAFLCLDSQGIQPYLWPPWVNVAMPSICECYLFLIFSLLSFAQFILYWVYCSLGYHLKSILSKR